MNVALLSNSLINRTLAFQTSYVLGNKIENIFLPLENHSKNEIFFAGQESIHVCENIEEIIDGSDIIIASSAKINRRLPKLKKVLNIVNPWKNENGKMTYIDELICTKTTPKIVILSLGTFTDIYYTEIIINKILSDCGAKVYQMFSEQTMSLLSDLSSNNLLNRSLSGINKEKADVIVVSVDGTRYRSDAEFVSELYHISPDLIFFCIDKTITNVNEICRVAEIVCKIGLTIRSPYVTYDVGTGVKYPVFSGACKEDSCVYSIDRDFETEIKKNIINNLYFPSGTVFL